MTLGLSLVIGGIVVALLAFAVGAYNMSSAFNHNHADDRGFIANHLGAMTVMGIGGALSLVGIILIVIHYANIVAKAN
jgi:hypothetical protein